MYLRTTDILTLRVTALVNEIASLEPRPAPEQLELETVDESAEDNALEATARGASLMLEDDQLSAAGYAAKDLHDPEYALTVPEWTFVRNAEKDGE
jgi:hypothetical protein